MPWPTKAVAGTKRVQQAYVHYPMRIVKEGGLISALLGKVARFINMV